MTVKAPPVSAGLPIPLRSPSKELSFGLKPRPHILYVIDQLCELGGAERALLRTMDRIDSSRFRVSALTFKINPEIEALKEIRAPLHVLPLNCTYDLNALRRALQLRDIIRSQRVSLVHTFFETSDLWAAPIAKLSGCAAVVSSRRDLGILRRGKHDLAYSVVNRIFDRVLAVSAEVRNFCILHDHLPPGRVETLYNGVDVRDIDTASTEYEARQAFKLPSNARLVTTLANIRSIKGIDVLARAASIVRRDFADVIFIVAGSVLEKEYFESLQRLVESLQLGNCFKFVGPLSNPFPLLKTSTVFCLPSRSEGFSNALIESMAIGLPSVVTKVGGNAEAVENDRTGYLVEVDDEVAMARRISQLLHDPVTARDMGDRARVLVEDSFGTQTMIDKLMCIYEQVLGETR